MRPNINGPFEITHMLTNGTATFKMGETKIKYTMYELIPYNYKTDVDDVHL